MDPVPRPSKLEAGVAGEAGRPGATPQLEGDMGNFCLRRAAQMGPWASRFKVSFSHCLYKWKRGSSSRGLNNGPAGCPAQPGRGALAANHCPLNAMPLKVSSWETGHWGLGPSCSPMFLLSPQSPELRGETGHERVSGKRTSGTGGLMQKGERRGTHTAQSREEKRCESVCGQQGWGCAGCIKWVCLAGERCL